MIHIRAACGYAEASAAEIGNLLRGNFRPVAVENSHINRRIQVAFRYHISGYGQTARRVCRCISLSLVKSGCTGFRIIKVVNFSKTVYGVFILLF